MALLLDLIAQYGLAFVFVCVLVEQAGAPIPAYPVLLVTGALAARGEFALPALLATAVVACLLADSAWYAAGQRVGTRVLRVLCRISLSPDGCVRQTESIFERWGAPSLMLAKFVPGFASVATAMAGSTRVRWASFLFFDAIGAALWAGLALAIGWLFSAAIEDVLLVLEEWGRWGLALIAAVLVLFVAAKWWQRYRFRKQLRMDRMTVHDLADRLQRGDPVVLMDVRSAQAQSEGRIPNAMAVADDDWPADIVTPDADAWVVVYCACPNEASAVLVARKLLQRGFKRVRPLEGGIDAWRAAGFEIARGAHDEPSVDKHIGASVPVADAPSRPGVD